VALHGWGANAQNLASVVPLLNLPNYQFMFPDAPFPHPYSSTGRAWYDLSYNKGQGLPESQKLLKDWLLSLESTTGVPLSRTILSGFSQGAAMTLDVGLSLPLAGLVALSGYLHPLSESTGRAFPPILIVHGRQDSVVPLKAAQSARDTLVALGVSVQYQEFDMGHEIRPEVLAVIRNFILRIMPKTN
jgi:phospholipase/carboxylesterase